MNALFQDLRFAIRTLLKYPGFSLTAVIALALGIGANTAIFTVVNSVLLRPLPFREPARLFRIAAAPPNAPDRLINMSDPALIALQQQARSFSGVISHNGGSKNLTGAGEPLQVNAAEVTTNFWSVLGVNAQLGRTFRAEEGAAGGEGVAVLSDAFWRIHFHADSNIVGKPLTLDGKPYTVIGVMPPGISFPSNGSVPIDLWLPAVLEPGNTHLAFRSVIGRLKPGVPRAQAQLEIDRIARALNSQNEPAVRGWLFRLHPLQETIVGDVRPALRVLLGSVAVLLLIACVNVANLLLARGTKRQQEIAVRSSLGASRFRLVRQLLTESAILALCGGAFGILAAAWGVAVFLKMTPEGALPRLAEVGIDPRVLAYTFLLSLGASLLFGLWPALYASGFGINETLKRGLGSLTARSQRARGVLVISEIALAFILLAGAGLMVKSFVKLRSVDPGFRPQNVISMEINLPETYREPDRMKSFHREVLERLQSLPGVDSASAVNYLPLARFLISGDFHAQGVPDPAARFNVTKPAVAPGYFRTMRIRLLKGRDFTDADDVKAPCVMIAGLTTAKRLWPDQDPIGRRITFSDDPKPEDWCTVIGVVDDVKQENLKQDSPPAIYRPLAQLQAPFFLEHMNYVVRASVHPEAIAGAMRKALRQVDASQPIYRLGTMDDLLNQTTAEPRFYSSILASFSVLALLLAAVGVYGVMAFSVAQRTREIGIRVALGARSGSIQAAVLGRSAVLIAVGLALGAGGALAVTRVLKSFLFEVRPADPETFLIASLLLAGVALLATYVPARRATSIDPLQALRYE